MLNIKKNLRTPLFWLFFVSLFFAHNYFASSVSLFSELGAISQEWILLIDLLLTLPLVYYLIFKPTFKVLLLKSISFLLLGIFIGSYIIPEPAKTIWPYFSYLRYIALALVLIFEVSLILSLIHIVKNYRSKNSNIEDTCTKAIQQKISNKALIQPYLLEARIWLYAFFIKAKKNLKFEGNQHFSYHQIHGNASNQLGFIFIILFEFPIMHLILHLAVSATVAYWVTGLTLYGLIFMRADYIATLKRPISISDQHLIIRYGVWGNLKLPLTAIKSIEAHDQTVKRSKNHLRFCQFGPANIKIQLMPGTQIDGFFGGECYKKRIYLAVDSPKELSTSLNKSLK